MGAGKWTEAVEAGLYSVGLEAFIHFHNVADPLSRISGRLHSFLQRMGLPGTFVTWPTMSNHRVYDLVRRKKTPLVVSLQGLMDRPTIEKIRSLNPIIRIIYLHGTPVRDEEQLERILDLDSMVDALGIPYSGDLSKLQLRGTQHTCLFPFAACPYHHKAELTRKARSRYGREVMLISRCGEYEEELVRLVSEELGRPVDVWGPGWSSSKHVTDNKMIFPPHHLEAFASSTIVLNLHGPDCHEHNGLNQNFFEIAAVGGFQITEHQPVLEKSALGRYTATFKEPRELARKVSYYLQDHGARETMRSGLQNHVLENETYGHRFFQLLKSMGYSD